MTLILHFGFPKTGTTSIQRAFSKNSERLREQGLLYPRTRGIKQSEMKHLISKKQESIAESELDHLAKVIDEAVEAQPSAHILVSAEELSAKNQSVLNHDSISKVKAYLRRWTEDVRLIGYVRRHDAYYLSAIQEGIKRGWRPPAPEAFRAGFSQTIGHYEQVFGTHAIVRPFEKQQWIGGDLLSDFLAQIKPIIDIPNSILVDGLERTNESLSAETMLALEIFYSQPGNEPTSTSYDLETAKKRWQAAKRKARDLGHNTKPALYSEVADIVMRENESDILSLRSNWGIEFKETPKTLPEPRPAISGDKIMLKSLICANQEDAYEILESKAFC